MGSLALWRGIEGAGKGMSQLAEQRMADESYEKRSGIDEAREQRMEKLRQENRIEIQSQSDAAAMERLEVSGEQAVDQIHERGDEARTTQAEGHEQNLEVEDTRAFNAEQRQIIDQNWQSVEKQLDRESRERIAMMGAGAGSSANKLLDKHLNRYTSKTLTKGEANEHGIVMSETQMPATYDDLEGVWYLQKDNMLFMPNESGVYEPRNMDKLTDAHLNALYQNPDKKGDFLQRYGFLPVHFLKAQMLSDMNQLMAPSATAPGSE